MRLAGIDIGSNAVRLLVADVYQQADESIKIKKIKLFRLPVRLGGEAFLEQRISENLIQKLVKAMQSFVLMMEVFGVEEFQACATSALREAKNGQDVIKRVKKESGIVINIINGQEEAKLILSNKLANLLDKRFPHLYVDVGGGSTEISLLDNLNINLSKSFKIGTLRLFQNRVKPEKWSELAAWLHKNIEPERPLAIIGSGGNINRVYKRSNNPKGQPLMYPFLKQERDLLATLSIEDRILLQDLNRDRAEVIVPALDIFLFIMEQTDIQQVIVPKIGLADGIVRRLYQKKMQLV